MHCRRESHGQFSVSFRGNIPAIALLWIPVNMSYWFRPCCLYVRGFLDLGFFSGILLWYLNLCDFFELWMFCFISLNQAVSRQVCQKDVTTLSLSSVWGSSDFMNICFSLGQFWCLILALAKYILCQVPCTCSCNDRGSFSFCLKCQWKSCSESTA